MSFEDTVKNVVTEVSISVKNITSVDVKDMQVTVQNNVIKDCSVHTKVCLGIMDGE